MSERAVVSPGSTPLTIVPIASTLIAGPYRRRGWRATLVANGMTIWRCECVRPHLSRRVADDCGLAELRARLGRRGMRVWTATYRPKQQFSEAEIASMDEARALALLEIQTAPGLPRWENPEAFPVTAEAARVALVDYERTMLEDTNWEAVRQTKRLLENIIAVFKEHTDIRKQAEITLMCGEKRIIGEFITAQQAGLVAVPGRPEKNPFGPAGLSVTQIFGKGGSAHVHRARVLHPLSYDEVRQKCRELHAVDKNATLHALFELINTEATRERRRASLYAEPFPEGMEYRIGDSREALADIADASVAAIVTDPPYGTDAEPLYVWLAQFAKRVLVPGGSLICYSGQGRLPQLYRIFSEQLTYWWTPILLHDAAQKMLGAGVRANHKPILWYVKDGFRRPVHQRKTIVPDVLNHQLDDDEARARSVRDKSDHLWSQGDAGVRVWVHHLTRPGERLTDDVWLVEPELIIDPFAGRGVWGRIAADMGRRWIGCDIEAGGAEQAMVDDLQPIVEDDEAQEAAD